MIFRYPDLYTTAVSIAPVADQLRRAHIARDRGRYPGHVDGAEKAALDRARELHVLLRRGVERRLAPDQFFAKYRKAFALRRHIGAEFMPNEFVHRYAASL